MDTCPLRNLLHHTICTSTAGAHHLHHHQHHSGTSAEHIEHICGQVLLSRSTSTRAHVTGVRLKTFIKEGRKQCNFRNCATSENHSTRPGELHGKVVRDFCAWRPSDDDSFAGVTLDVTHPFQGTWGCLKLDLRNHAFQD